MNKKIWIHSFILLNIFYLISIFFMYKLSFKQDYFANFLITIIIVIMGNILYKMTYAFTKEKERRIIAEKKLSQVEEDYKLSKGWFSFPPGVKDFKCGHGSPWDRGVVINLETGEKSTIEEYENNLRKGLAKGLTVEEIHSGNKEKVK